MKKNPNYTITRRMLSFVMVLLMAFPWVVPPAMAASEWTNGLEIKISWTDINGNTVESEAAFPITWVQGDVFWLTVPGDILQNSLTLKINNPNYPGYTYTPGNGESLGIVAGAENFESTAVYINVNDENGTPITDPATAIRLYISAMPKPPAEADIRVIYQGTDGASLRGDGSFHAVEGQENRITPEQTSFENGYTLSQETPEFTISFDENGAPNMSAVTFLYNPPVPSEADIRVVYQGTDGTSLRGDGSFHAVEGQENRIMPEQTSFENGYTLSQETPEFTISFDENGAPNTGTVTFLYNPPAPSEADIRVIYQGTDGTSLRGDGSFHAVEGQENRITPEQTSFENGYTLSAETPEFTISFDENGAPNTGTVTFLYNPPAPAEADIRVVYQGTDGTSLRGDGSFHAVKGQENRITPEQTSFENGYTLSAETPEFTISFDENGAPNMGTVTFLYNPPAPSEADIRVIYQGTDGISLRGDGSFHAVEGQENRITPEQTSFENGYTLSQGTPEFTITFDENGAPSTGTVTFLYNPPAVQPTEQPTPEPPAQKEVDVFYKGNDGADLGSVKYTAVEGGENRVEAPPTIETQPGYIYTLSGEGVYFITIDESGNASPSPVIFLYEPPAPVTPEPPAEMEIDVRYVGTDEADLGSYKFKAVEGQENRIEAPTTPESHAGYTLTGDSVQYVTINSNGEANPSSVIFRYTPNLIPVPIEYLKDSQYLGEGSQNIPAGSNNVPVNADPNMTPAGYRLEGASPVNVTVDAQGKATPEKVTFNFVKIPAQTVLVPIEYTKEGVVFKTDSKPIAIPGNGTVDANPDPVPEGYRLEGAASVSVTVDAQGKATPEKVIFNYVPIPAASIRIEYLKDGQYLGEGSVGIPAGSQNVPVNADPNMTPAGYRLEGASPVNVTVDAQGKATPEKVTFNFVKIPAHTVQVPIEYIKEGVVFKTDSKPIAIPGNGTVDANPNPVPEGYRLEGAASVSVTVDAQGRATPEKVIFNYVQIPIATIRIEYLKDGQYLGEGSVSIPAGSQNVPVNADPNRIPAGYRLEGASTINVSVDVSGTATPGKVTFNYVPIPAVQKTITVYYRNESNGDIATAQQKALGAGTHQISPEPSDLQTNYRIKGDTVKTVTVNQDGTSNVDSVTFVYEYVPPVVETPIPVGSVIDRWGVINNNNVNFRSSPTKASNNGIKKLSKNAYVWMYESQYNNANEVWTHVNVGDQDGYIMTEFVNMMTQAESDAYQATLQNPMPTRKPAPTNTNSPTPTPKPTPTAVPSQYTGDALTNRQAALRTAVSNSDQSILTTLPMNTLVKVKYQVYQGSTPWSQVETLDGLIGYVPDDSLRRITPEEAKYYIDQYNAAHPTASPTPTPTPSPAPVQQHGYAATLGDNVPMRGAADPNSMLVNMLAKNTVVYVSGQEYLNGAAWHIVQYKGQWGYIRADQLRWLSRQETEAYLKSLNTPTPTPANTLPPLNQNSASSYGYVTSDKVNFRSSPDGSVTGTLNKYAFALVLGSTQSGGKTWYKVNQAGREGYISGDFFHVLSLAELEDFLQSPEYAQGSTGNTGNNNSGNDNSEPPTSPEDMNVGTWTNPNTGLNANYEPFDPYTTPEPIPTPTPSPTPEPLATFEPLPMEPPVETQSDSSSFLWMGLGVTLLGGVGGLYAYALHKSNQHKAAARAAQRRAAMQQNMQSGARPYARATNAPLFPQASGTQARPGTPPAGAQRPQTPGGTSPYNQSPAATRPPAQTGNAPTARPGQQPGAFTRSVTGTQPGTQTPASVRSEAQGISGASDGQSGAAQHDSALNNTTRQPKAVRHTGNSPADQSTPTDTNENL